MYKRFVLVVLVIVLLMSFFASCAPQKWFLLQSEGIATYNRHTGQFEILWYNHQQAQSVVHDTVEVDSSSRR